MKFQMKCPQSSLACLLIRKCDTLLEWLVFWKPESGVSQPGNSHEEVGLSLNLLFVLFAFKGEVCHFFVDVKIISPILV